MKKKLTLAGIAVFVLLASGIAYVAWPRQTNKKVTQADVAKNAAKAQAADSKALDQKTADGLKSMLTIIANYYSKQGGGYPAATADGWTQILNSVYTNSSFISPYTNTFYAYSSSNTPQYGQIQYGPGKACKNNQFADSHYRSLALRTKTVAGYACEGITVQNGSQTQ